MPTAWIDGIIVFLLGVTVGIGELVARYRDEPRRAITTSPAMLYVAINGLASLFALVAILTFGWTASPTASSEEQRLLRILAAGFGAMALFRTSLFVVRVGTTDVGVGPIAFLQIILGATDRGVDRKRASNRAERVVRIMGDLDFEKVFKALPAFAIMLMQNLTLEDQKAIGDQVSALAQPESDMPPQAKVLNLGLLLMNFVGEEVLEDAVRGIRGQLKLESRPISALGARLSELRGRDGDAGDQSSSSSRGAAGGQSDVGAAGGQGSSQTDDLTRLGENDAADANLLTVSQPESPHGAVADADPDSAAHHEPIQPAAPPDSTPPPGQSAPGTAIPPN